jgi:hypothetical protein
VNGWITAAILIVGLVLTVFANARRMYIPSMMLIVFTATWGVGIALVLDKRNDGQLNSPYLIGVGAFGTLMLVWLMAVAKAWGDSKTRRPIH